MRSFNIAYVRWRKQMAIMIDLLHYQPASLKQTLAREVSGRQVFKDNGGHRVSMLLITSSEGVIK
jgi:hypothetical protein